MTYKSVRKSQAANHHSLQNNLKEKIASWHGILQQIHASNLDKKGNCICKKHIAQFMNSNKLPQTMVHSAKIEDNQRHYNANW